jgi:hypothetical protein
MSNQHRYALAQGDHDGGICFLNSFLVPQVAQRISRVQEFP